MLVRAKELCIINSSRVRAGTVFDYALGVGENLPPHLVPVEGAPAPVVEETEIWPTEIAGKKLEFPKTIHDHAKALRSK